MVLRVGSLAELRRLQNRSAPAATRARPAPRVEASRPPTGLPILHRTPDGLWVAMPLPGKPLTANEREHYMARSVRVDLWRSTTAMLARQVSRAPLDASFVTVIVPSRVRDDANLAPSAKPVIDGLVDAGWWPDDDNRRVHQMQPMSSTRPGVFAVAVTSMAETISVAYAQADACRAWMTGLR